MLLVYVSRMDTDNSYKISLQQQVEGIYYKQ